MKFEMILNVRHYKLMAVFSFLRSLGFISVFGILFSGFYCGAQTFLNVTNFGAAGDAEGLTVSCASNSSEYSIVSTNWSGTHYAPQIGDVIEVFRAGPWLSFSNDPPYMTVPFYGTGNTNTYVIVTNQDIICLITNITDGTNLWCPIPAGWTMNADCVVGTNNAAAFQAAADLASNIVATSEFTNVTIQIPAGTYLLIPSNVLNPNFVLPNIAGPEGDNNECAVRISSGGITLSGDSAADTVLMGCGAGMEHDLANSFPYGNGYFNPFRGEMFLTGNNAGAGIGVMNNQYPLVFQNLTCDGGLTNGYCPDNQYWILTPGNGDGWDTTHHVALDFSYDQGQMHQLKVFQNCIFQHWRGEMLISGVGNGGTNTFICVTNCVFNDGDASGFNFTFANSIINCVFTNINKVLEFYQSYATAPCLFESNVCSVPGKSLEFTIVGSVTNVQPQPSWYIYDNTFLLNVGQTAIQLSPAENVVISNNYFNGAAGNAAGINFDSAGVQPSDGSATGCSNIDIVNNTANLSFGSLVIFAYYEENCLISNNVLQAGTLLNTWYSGFATNNLVVANQDPGGELSLCGIQNGQYPLISTNNVFGSFRWDVFYPSTNEVDWCDGNYQHWDLNWTGSVWYLGTNSLIPPSSFLSLSNGSGGPLQIYYDSSRTTYTNIPNLTTAVLQWNGRSWSANKVTTTDPPSVSTTVSPTNGVSRLTVHFSSASEDTSGNPIKSWLWNFGDGTMSAAESPSHTYTNLGTCYPVLTVSNAVGLIFSSSARAVTVTNPSVKFTASATNTCPGLAILFKCPSTDSGDNAIKSWSWNFGDGTTSTNQNPTHTYAALGLYTPTLTVANVCGLSPSSSGPGISVNNLTVHFTASPSNGVSRLSVAFKAPKVDSAGIDIKSWLWNFGDGTTSTAENPTHAYVKLGPYSPTLIIGNADGMRATNSVAITVTNPIVNFTASPTNGAPSLKVSFRAPTVDSGHNAIKKWIWNFGDGTTSTVENPTHSYTNYGWYYPTLTVTNTYGLTPSTFGPRVVVGSLVIPRLSIAASGPNMVLSWPTNAVGYTLQYSTNLQVWNPVFSSRVTLDGKNIVTNPISQGQMFFRLNE